MKKSIILITSALLVIACNYEPVPKVGEPSVIFDTDAVSGYPGETVTVTGTAADPAGLAGITLKVGDWNYSESREFTEYAPSSYAFSFDVVIPESAAAPARMEVTAFSAVSGNAVKSLEITLTEKPEPVVDLEAPVITMDSPAEAKVGESYEFSLTFSDDVGIIECWPKLHITKGWSDYPTVDGNAYDTNGYSIIVSGSKTTFTCTLDFPSGGTYDVIVYDSTEGVSDGIHTLERAEDWSIAKFTIEVERPASSDTEAPSITMNSPSTAVLGEPYTLSLTFSDDGGMEQAWPKVTVACGDVMPQELVDNWNGWWPEVNGTSVTVEQPLTFTQAGVYQVHIESVTDLAGNHSEEKDWFTITVSDGAPAYLTLDELPASLTLTLDNGLASYTLYIKGNIPEGTTSEGVEFDLYDGAWTKLVPYGCTNTWDWGNWDMWGQTDYTLERTISFDTAGFYYLYIGEKWSGGGYNGHQIDITVQ